MKNLFIFVLLGSLVIAFTDAQSSSNSGQIGGQEDYDLVGGDGIVEEATTPRPKRRRLPGSRAKPSVQSDVALDSPAPIETSPTEKTTKRSRTSVRDDSTPSSRSAAKPTDATEQPVGSTYRRPKFPPRRLSFPIKRTTTVAPVEITEEFLYEDEPLAPEGQAAQGGQHAESPVDETIAQGAR